MEDSPLRHAPHPAADVVVERVDARVHARAGRVPRRRRADPLGPDKYWPPVSRIDGAFGDRNLMCSCPPLSAVRGGGLTVARPQPGIFAQGTRSHYHLEFDLRPDATDDAMPRRAGRAARTVGHRRRFEHRGGVRPRGVATPAARRRAGGTRRLRGRSRATADARRRRSTTSGCGPTAPARTSSSTSRARSSRSWRRCARSRPSSRASCTSTAAT